MHVRIWDSEYLSRNKAGNCKGISPFGQTVRRKDTLIIPKKHNNKYIFQQYRDAIPAINVHIFNGQQTIHRKVFFLNEYYSPCRDTTKSSNSMFNSYFKQTHVEISPYVIVNHEMIKNSTKFLTTS